MEKLSILTADMLDILFEYRNKMYGAYELRKTYPKRMAYALGGTILFCFLFVLGTILASNRKTRSSVDIATEFEIAKYVEPVKPVEPPPVIPKQEIKKIEIEKFTPPAIVKDELVKPEDEIKEIAKLEETKVGAIHQEGDKFDGIVAPPVESVTGKVAEPKVEEDYDRVFTVVQYAAEFEGGAAGWEKYLRKNLNSELPAENGAPAGRYTVMVVFTVGKDGRISDVTAENDPGYGTKAEAIRVIQKGPNWKPANQNGRAVNYRHRQSITFLVEEQ